ncbi:MAG: hypothetical protein IT381_24330 [Deltaproteobacteria bacterium]|nr:hypothetical protein [Deltaproteobacteria bacterium]
MSGEEVASSEIKKELDALEPITREIKDKRLKDDVVKLLTAEILARLSLRAIGLEPFEEPDYAAPDIDMWDQVAQPVRSALIALLELRKLMGELAPIADDDKTPEVDVAFDLVDDASVAAAPPVRDNVFQQVDDWVQSTLGAGQRDLGKKLPDELWKEVQASLQPLAGIVVQETQRFATRLRNQTIVVSRWMLLAELQEFKGKFQKLLGALRLGLLHPFTNLPDAELLGDYRTEEQGSVLLRRAFYRLERDVNALIAVHASGNEDEQRFALEELLVRMMRFARSDAFSLVRAPDKRALIEFRQTLAQELGKKTTTARRITEIFEDLSKFLDMMHGLNRREVLQKHDREGAAELRSRVLVVEEVLSLDLESAKKLLAEAKKEARAMLGKDPLLDIWLENELPCETKDDLVAIVHWLNHAVARLRF